MKRPWDAGVSNTTPATPFDNLARQQDIHKPLEALQWKRRRQSPQVQDSPGWEATLQTSLWLAQQNSLQPNTSMNPARAGHASWPNQNAPVSSANDAAITPDSAPIWPSYGEDIGNPRIFDRRHSRAPMTSTAPSRRGELFRSRCKLLLLMRLLIASVSYGQLHGPSSEFSTYNDEQETATPHSRRSDNVTNIELACERCSKGKPMIQEVIATLTELDISLTSRERLEVFAQVS